MFLRRKNFVAKKPLGAVFKPKNEVHALVIRHISCPAGRPSRSQSLCFTYEFVRQKSTFFILSTPPFDFERAGVCSSTVTVTQKYVKFVDFSDEARYFGNRVTLSLLRPRERKIAKMAFFFDKTGNLTNTRSVPE